MAENIVQARILLRYGTYSQWMNNDDILREGEAAIATFPYNYTIYPNGDYPANTPPAVGIKIGNGKKTFRELPWIQAIAADVYSWAKDSEKPNYTAQEIEGLQNYIADYISEHGGGGGSSGGTVAARLYRIIEGTGANRNKFYLEYKEDTENSQWITDTSRSIDLSEYYELINWIGKRNIENYDSLYYRTEDQISRNLNQLNYTDSEPSGVVTSVNQTNGQIDVTKRALEFNDITGTLEVNKGGTGKISLNEGQVLIGNGTDPITTLPIAEEVGANDYLVSNRLMKSYVEGAVANLEDTMHFRGEATVTITPNGSMNPNIRGYNFSQAQSGDVILANNTQEFVWTGGNWRLLGDEGSYAVKGQIVNNDISPEAAIAQYKIDGLESALNSKVDKEEDKTLISLEEKTKLANIEPEAQVNTIERIVLNESEVPITGEKTIVLNIPVLTAQQLEQLDAAEANKIDNIFVNGVRQEPTKIDIYDKSVNISFIPFTQTEKDRLESISEGAQVNTIENIFINGVLAEPTEINNLRKSVAIDFYPYTEIEHNKLRDIEEEADVNIIEAIQINGRTIAPNEQKVVNINNIIEHIFVNGNEQRLETVDEKVNSINIKFLEFTTNEKNKLASIQEGAQVNTIEYLQLNGRNLANEDKVVNISNIIEHIFVNDDEQELETVNEKANSINIKFIEFTTDEKNKLAGIQTGAQVNVIEHLQLNGRNLVNEDKVVNINNIIEHIFVNDNEQRLETVNGKANSINIKFIEFTADEKNKLAGIQTGAQVNTIEYLQLDGRNLDNENKTIDLTLLANKIEKIQINGVEQLPNAQKIINLEIDPHNIIESISVDGQNVSPDEDKNIDLNLSYIKGAIVPNGNTTESVEIIQKQLQLARVAKTGNIEDLIQTNNTFIILDCGTSTSTKHSPL